MIMLTWNPDSAIPAVAETAVIAIAPDYMAPEDSSPFLLGEVFRFDLHHQRWIGATSGLLLKYTTFWWAREEDVLASLKPQLTIAT